MKASRRAGSIYATSNSKKSQSSLKMSNRRYSNNQNVPASVQYQNRVSDGKYQRHYDNESLQRKLEKRRTQRNHSSGQIMRKSLAQTTNSNYCDRKSQQKYQDVVNHKLDYQRTIQKLRQNNHNPRNRQYQDYPSHPSHLTHSKALVNQSCNTNIPKKNTMALTNILNYNFSGQMMSKTAKLRTSYDYCAKNSNSELPTNKTTLREQKKEPYEFQKYRLRDVQRQVDRQAKQKDKQTNHKEQRQLKMAMTEYTPYHYENLKNQKIKKFQQRYNTILSSYQRRKRQLSQEFNRMQTKQLIKSKSINSKINYQGRSKSDFQNIKTQHSTKKTIQNHQSKYLNKYNGSCSGTYQKSLLSNTAKVPIENLMQNIKERNQKVQTKLTKMEQIEKDINDKLNKIDRQKSKSKAKIKSNNAHEEFKQFFKALDQQVQYEEKLRNLKHQIDNHSKINEITSNLALKGIAKQELKLSSEQYDPFQSTGTENQKSERQVNDIVEQYYSYRTKCEQNWQAKFLNMWNQQVIKRLFEKLDYSKKTQLSLKEFVREFNCLTNKTLKTRDLYKVSERLKPMTKVNFLKRLSKIEI